MNAQAQDLIVYIEANAKKPNQWEQQFIESVKSQMNNRTITSKQIKVLSEIYRRTA